MADEPVSMSALEEVSHAAFSGVLRAVEARQIPIEKFPGPILVGLIAWPQLSQLGNISVPDAGNIGDIGDVGDVGGGGL